VGNQRVREKIHLKVLKARKSHHVFNLSLPSSRRALSFPLPTPCLAFSSLFPYPCLTSFCLFPFPCRALSFIFPSQCLTSIFLVPSSSRALFFPRPSSIHVWLKIHQRVKEEMIHLKVVESHHPGLGNHQKVAKSYQKVRKSRDPHFYPPFTSFRAFTFLPPSSSLASFSRPQFPSRALSFPIPSSTHVWSRSHQTVREKKIHLKVMVSHHLGLRSHQKDLRLTSHQKDLGLTSHQKVRKSHHVFALSPSTSFLALSYLFQPSFLALSFLPPSSDLTSFFHIPFLSRALSFLNPSCTII